MNLKDRIQYVGLDYFLEESKTFCILPWMHMYVNTDSSVWSCCVNKTMTTANHGYEETNIMTQPIPEIINNDYFKELRLDMINDIKNPNCKDCYLLEDSSGHSYRNDFNEQFKEHSRKLLETNDDGSVDNFETIYLDFRFSNLCNFKCRSCRPEWSSTWAKEAKDNEDHPHHGWGGKLTSTVGDVEYTQKDNYKRHGMEKEEFINKFKEVFNSTQRLYFAGGEPLAAKEQYWILEYLIDMDKRDIIIEYNTNLSMLKNNKLKLSVVDYWEQFNNISIRASLDGSGKRAEYIRHGTDWKVIEENFRYIIENLPNVNMGISSVFQLTNALHLPDFYQDWVDNGLLNEERLHNTFIIPLTGPEQLSSQILPKELKLKVEEKWEKFLSELPGNINNLKGYVHSCIDYMNEQDLYESNKNDFIEYTKYLDKIRNESFSETFPELKDYFEVV